MGRGTQLAQKKRSVSHLTLATPHRAYGGPRRDTTMAKKRKRIPLWMKVDATMALVGLIIVTLGIWVAHARIFD